MSQTWVRTIVGLLAFAVVFVIVFNVIPPPDLTPDPATGVPVGFGTVMAQRSWSASSPTRRRSMPRQGASTRSRGSLIPARSS